MPNDAIYSLDVPEIHFLISFPVIYIQYFYMSKKPVVSGAVLIPPQWGLLFLTHWGRVTHICVGNLTIIGSNNGLSPSRHRAIIWTNAGILSIGHFGINFSEIFIEILIFSLNKMHLKMSSAKWRPFCLGINVLSWPPEIQWNLNHIQMTAINSARFLSLAQS